MNDRVYAAVDPPARDGNPDIRAILVIGHRNADFAVTEFRLHIIDCQVDRFDDALPGCARIQPVQVGEYAQLDDAGRIFRGGLPRDGQGQGKHNPSNDCSRLYHGAASMQASSSVSVVNTRTPASCRADCLDTNVPTLP